MLPMTRMKRVEMAMTIPAKAPPDSLWEDTTGFGEVLVIVSLPRGRMATRFCFAFSIKVLCDREKVSRS